MGVETAIYQRSGRTPVFWILSLISLAGLIPALLAVFQLNWGIAFANAVFFALFAAGAYWVHRRHSGTGVFLTAAHLIARDATGDDTQVPIKDAFAYVSDVVAGSSIAPMTRTLELPDDDGIPTQRILVVSHGSSVTELFAVRGMTPPRMRSIRDEINAALAQARKAAGMPPLPNDSDAPGA